MTKGYVFDFDYTLADATMGVVSCFNYALEKMGLQPLSIETIKKTIGYALNDAYAMVTNDNCVANGNKFTEYFLEKAPEVMTNNTIIFPTAIKAINALYDRGMCIAIVTSKRHARIFEALCKFNLQDKVHFIIGSDDVQQKKPHPEGVFLALKLMQLLPEQIIYVGDSIVDAKTAQSATVDFIGVTTGTTTKGELLQFPHLKIVQSLDEIL